MNKMVQSFSKIINGMLTAVNDLVSTGHVLRIRSEYAARGAHNQHNQASQIATAAEKMSQTITDIARNASVASETSEEAMQTASKGKEVAEGAVDSVNRVYTSTVELTTIVEKLNNSATEIGGIVTVIKDIAGRTKFLALNAAIEAARAGKHGRGFAVVADEVGVLAERTIKATSEIAEKIHAVQTETQQTAKSVEETLSEVTKATQYMRDVGDALSSILEETQKVRNQMTQIATTVDDQSAVSEKVANNIKEISAISKDIERMADVVMNEVNVLTKIEEEFRNFTVGFKTEGSELMIFDFAKADHMIFTGKVRAYLNGDVTLDLSQMPDHYNCRLGKWYFGEGMQMCGTLPSFKAIDEPHARIHALAKEAVSAYNAGDKAKAERLCREMEDVSDQIVSLLDEAKRECNRK